MSIEKVVHVYVLVRGEKRVFFQSTTMLTFLLFDQELFIFSRIHF